MVAQVRKYLSGSRRGLPMRYVHYRMDTHHLLVPDCTGCDDAEIELLAGVFPFVSIEGRGRVYAMEISERPHQPGEAAPPRHADGPAGR